MVEKYKKNSKVWLKIKDKKIKGLVIQDDKFKYLGINSKKPQMRRQIEVKTPRGIFFVDAKRIKKRIL